MYFSLDRLLELHESLLVLMLRLKGAGRRAVDTLSLDECLSLKLYFDDVLDSTRQVLAAMGDHMEPVFSRLPEANMQHRERMIQELYKQYTLES